MAAKQQDKASSERVSTGGWSPQERGAKADQTDAGGRIGQKRGRSVKHPEETLVGTSGKSARVAQRGPKQPCCPRGQDHERDSPGKRRKSKS